MIWQYERSGHSCFGGRNRCFFGGKGFLKILRWWEKISVKSECRRSFVRLQPDSPFMMWLVLLPTWHSWVSSNLMLSSTLPGWNQWASQETATAAARGTQGGKWFRWSNFANFNGSLFVFVPSNLSHLGHPDHYPSSHNHGSEKWFPPIVLTFRIEPFSTSMIMGERVNLWLFLLNRLDSAVGLFSKRPFFWVNDESILPTPLKENRSSGHPCLFQRKKIIISCVPRVGHFPRNFRWWCQVAIVKTPAKPKAWPEVRGVWWVGEVPNIVGLFFWGGQNWNESIGLGEREYLPESHGGFSGVQMGQLLHWAMIVEARPMEVDVWK